MTTHQHPKALPYLFLTEMWERFGFYVVQGMLVLYMSKKFGFSDDESYTIMGAFSALAYIAPFVGGYLAQRFLGFQTAIFWGGLFLSSGYAILAISYPHTFYFSLATIIVGNGLFKPNISSLLGVMYEKDDPLRDSGFTLFYIGINLGVLLAGVSSGYIKDHFGWSAGFGLASIGLLIGLVTFHAGINKFLAMKNSSGIVNTKTSFLVKTLIILACLTSIWFVSLLLRSALLAKWLIPIAGIFLLIFLTFLTMKQTGEARRRLFTLNILIVSSIVFWMIFLQLFNSASLFIERLVDKNIYGWHIPTTAFYSLESLFIILLGPGLAWSWQTLNEADKNPSTVLKFIVAIFLVGVGALILGLSTLNPGVSHLVNPLWIALSYFFITAGEMFLSPIGLSAVTMLSPPNIVGMMMGIWFVAIGFGGEFAGWLAKLANIPAGITDPTAQLTIYRHAFYDYAYIAFGVAVGLFILKMILGNIIESDAKELS